MQLVVDLKAIILDGTCKDNVLSRGNISYHGDGAWFLCVNFDTQNRTILVEIVYF